MLALIFFLVAISPAKFARTGPASTPDAGAPDSSPAGAPLDADRLLALLDDWQAGIQDLSADFEQVYTHPLAKAPRQAFGVVDVKRPGLVRMETTRPERRLLILNEQGAVVYEPRRKQAFVGRVARVEELSFFSFLSEAQALKTMFTPRLLSTDASTRGGTARHVIELLPRGAASSFSRLVLTLSVAPVRLCRVIVVEHSGALNVFTITRLRENIGLAKRHFRFSRPPGVRAIPLSAPEG